MCVCVCVRACVCILACVRVHVHLQSFVPPLPRLCIVMLSACCLMDGRRLHEASSSGSSSAPLVIDPHIHTHTLTSVDAYPAGIFKGSAHTKTQWCFCLTSLYRHSSSTFFVSFSHDAPFLLFIWIPHTQLIYYTLTYHLYRPLLLKIKIIFYFYVAKTNDIATMLLIHKEPTLQRDIK